MTRAELLPHAHQGTDPQVGQDSGLTLVLESSEEA